MLRVLKLTPPPPGHTYEGTQTTTWIKPVQKRGGVRTRARAQARESWYRCLWKIIPPEHNINWNDSFQSTKSGAGEQFLLLGCRARARRKWVFVSLAPLVVMRVVILVIIVATLAMMITTVIVVMTVRALRRVTMLSTVTQLSIVVATVINSSNMTVTTVDLCKAGFRV